MITLGSYLKHPNDRKRQISHSYLRQIEEGMRERLHPLLPSICEAYEKLI